MTITMPRERSKRILGKITAIDVTSDGHGYITVSYTHNGYSGTINFSLGTGWVRKHIFIGAVYQFQDSELK